MSCPGVPKRWLSMTENSNSAQTGVFEAADTSTDCADKFPVHAVALPPPKLSLICQTAWLSKLPVRYECTVLTWDNACAE